MSLIVTPRRLDQFGELYHQLGGTLSSGINLLQGVEMIRDAPPSGSFRQHLQSVLNDLKGGLTLSEALARRGRWLPDFDIALIAAGEKSGRLDACFHTLAEYYQERARLLRSVISALAYPAFLVLLVLLVFPPGQLTAMVQTQNVAAFLVAKGKVLLLVGLAEVAILALNQGARFQWWRAFSEELLARVPVLGKARRSLALGRLCMALEALLNAGSDTLKAWDLAGAASGSPALRRAIARALPRMAGGETPGEAIAQGGVFPPKFLSVYRSGEVSGRIDQSLEYLRKDYTEDATRLYQRFAEWMPRLIFMVIALLIGYFVVTFWVGYFNGMLDMLDKATQGQ